MHFNYMVDIGTSYVHKRLISDFEFMHRCLHLDFAQGSHFCEITSHRAGNHGVSFSYFVFVLIGKCFEGKTLILMNSLAARKFDKHRKNRALSGMGL